MPESEEEKDHLEDEENYDPPEDDGSEEPGREATPERSGEDEYFLAIDDRTRYKTREEAIKGIRNAGERIASYSRFGSPEEIADRMQRLELLQSVLEGKPGAEGRKVSGEDMDALLKDVPDRERGAWKQFLERFDQLAPQRGWVQKDDVERMVSERTRQEIQRVQQEDRARQEFRSLLEGRGLNVTPELEYAVENAVVGLMERDRELSEMWRRGDLKAFASRAFDVLYGPSPASTPQQTNGSEEKPRDGRGRFQKAAEYQDTKERTQRLPKAPPKSGGAAPETQDPNEERKKLATDDGYRLRKFRELLASRGAEV